MGIVCEVEQSWREANYLPPSMEDTSGAMYTSMFPYTLTACTGIILYKVGGRWMKCEYGTLVDWCSSEREKAKYSEEDLPHYRFIHNQPLIW